MGATLRKIAQLVQNGWKENLVVANAFETVQSDPKRYFDEN